MTIPHFASRIARCAVHHNRGIILCGLAILVLCSGCVRYSHSHFNPADGTTDKTSFGAFIYAGNASKIRSTMKMGTNYSRTVSVGTVEGKGDSEFIAALAAGIIEGMKKSQGIP